MIASGLTWCSLAILAIAAGCVGRAAIAEFRWFGDVPIASLLMGVGFPAMAFCQPLLLGLLGWSARRRGLAALVVFVAAIPVSAVTVYCWAAAQPSGPDAYEVLGILRALGALATMPVVLVVVLVVVWLVPAPARATPA